MHPSAGIAETGKIMWILEKFINFKEDVGLDVGCGKWKIPGSIGIDRREDSVADVKMDAAITSTAQMPDGLKKYISRCDYVFSSHFLEDFEWDRLVEVSKFYIDVFLVSRGLFIAYVPHRGVYRGVNLDHKHEFGYGDMEKLFYQLKLLRAMIYYEGFLQNGKYGILGIGRAR